jgi:hypothetical protein
MKNLERFLLVLAAASMLAACDVEVTTDDDTKEALAAAEVRLAEMAAYDQQIALVNAWIETWGSADIDKIDTIAASDYKRTAPDLNTSSLEELKAFILQVHEAYPDYAISNDGIAAGPDGVFVQWTVTGSDTGRAEGATGNSLRVTGMSRYAFSEGKIAKEIVIFDTGSVLAQLETAEMPHTAE